MNSYCLAPRIPCTAGNYNLFFLTFPPQHISIPKISVIKTFPALDMSKETTPSRSSLPPQARGKTDAQYKKQPKKISGFFKRVQNEWSNTLLKLKEATQVSYSDDEEVGDLFEDNGPLDFDRSTKLGRLLNDAEEQFLEDYRKYKDLDKVYEQHQEKYGAPKSKALANRNQLYNIDRVSFQTLDMTKLRSEYIAMLKQNNSGKANGDDDSYSTIGEALWEFRRTKWLSVPGASDEQVEEKVTERRETSCVKSIPKEHYHRIYTNLVEKSKPFKDDIHINLEDLISIINDGWKKEEKWDRAAKGAP